MGKRQTGGGLSLRTKDATSGGGTEGALATITEIGFVDEFTYGGRQKDKPQAALRVEYEIEGFDKPWEQHYTVGPSEKYEVIEDGDGIKGLGKATGLNQNCNALRFIKSVEDAAEAADIDLDDVLPALDDGGNSVRPLEGRQVRLTNVKFETVGGDQKELIVIGEFADEGVEAPTTKGRNGKANGKASKGPSIEEATAMIVKGIVDGAGTKGIKKGDLGNLVYQEDRKNPDIKAMMQLCFKDAFLSEIEGVEYDKKKGVLKSE